MTLIQFDDGSGRRIGDAVRFVEVLAGKRKPLLFEALTAEYPKRGLRLATFTGSWSTGTWKTVTLHGSTQTASVYNWCNAAIAPNAAESRYVIVGSVNGTQSAVEIQMQSTAACQMSLGSIDLTQLEGYDAGQIQMLGHNSTGPCLQWYSITTCSTATAA